MRITAFPKATRLAAAIVLSLACVLSARFCGAATPKAAPVMPATAAQVRALAERPGAHVTLVNVWATWCAPCREEFPALLHVARAHEHEGARLVLVSADFSNQMPAIHKFLAAHGVTDTTYLKSGGDMDFIDGLNRKWSGALPATFIYDARGHLITFWEGIADSARFDRALSEALHTTTQRKEPSP